MTDDYCIRQTRDLADANALATIGAQTFADTFGHLYAEADLNAFLRESHSVEGARALLTDPKNAVWLVELAGDVVGYCICGPCDLPVPGDPKNAGELIRLYVAGDHQGARLGARLLTMALDWLDQRFDEIFLSVYQENHGAQRLYKRHGFEIIHKYEFMVGSHADPEFIMQKVR